MDFIAFTGVMEFIYLSRRFFRTLFRREDALEDYEVRLLAHIAGLRSRRRIP